MIPPSTPGIPEFDAFAAGDAAGMENPLKRLAGRDAHVFIDLEAWHMLGDLARRPLPTRPPSPRLLDCGCGAGAFMRALARRASPARWWAPMSRPACSTRRRGRVGVEVRTAHPVIPLGGPYVVVADKPMTAAKGGPRES
jgi:hypothetical protein